MLTNNDILLSATLRRDDIEEELPAAVTVRARLADLRVTCAHGYSTPPTAGTFSLSDVLDGTATLCDSPIYRHGVMTCGNCNFAAQEICPYSVADTMSVNGADYSVTDADFLPLCPVRRYGLVAAYKPARDTADNYYISTRPTGRYSTPPTSMYVDDAADSDNNTVGTFDD